MNLDDLLIRAQAPIRYLNREINSCRKDPSGVKLKVAMCFPDLYEIGISHLGHRLLYHILNRRPEVLCDRVYAPWTDFAQLLKKESVPLFGAETRMPLAKFDLLGFTLPNELCYSNLLYMLELAGIPLRAHNRMEGEWPLVIAGGPCASNPEPLAPFFDAFFFGEADEAILEIAEAVLGCKNGGVKGKEALLRELCKIQGVYVPAFYSPEQKDGRFIGLMAKSPAPPRIRRRLVPDLDAVFFPTRELVPFAEAVHDRYVIEIARGCTRGCRFCHAGIIYRPYRERSPQKVLELARQGLQSTGYEELSLLSLSAGDYSSIEELIVRLIVEHYPKRVSVSLPSLRVASLSPVLLEAIKRVRKTGFTIAPEAGTERLRRVLNKEISDREIMETAEKVLKAGWRSLKFYFMAGLPTETGEDLAGIVELGRGLSRLARKTQPSAQLSLSMSGFVPKPHTAFQWEKQLEAEELREIQTRLKKDLSRERIKLKFEDPRNSLLEGVFSRAGREMADCIEAAVKKGACFDGWAEQFKLEIWFESFQEKGINYRDYLKQRPEDLVFPCEHMDSCVTKRFLREERNLALRGEPSDDCRIGGCSPNCGVCDHKLVAPRVSQPLAKRSPEELITSLDRLPRQPELYFRYLVKYQRMGDLRFLGLLENNRMFLRAVRRANLAMRYSQGFHPLPKISFSSNPPVGVESETEFVELEIMEHIRPEQLLNSLQQAMPPGIEIKEVKELNLKTPSISQMISSIEYLAITPMPLHAEITQDKIAAFQARDTLLIEQVREKGNRSIDLKQKVKSIEITFENNVKFVVVAGGGPSAKPQEVMAAVFGISREDLFQVRFVRTGVGFREERPIEYPGTAVRSRPAAPFRRK